MRQHCTVELAALNLLHEFPLEAREIPRLILHGAPEVDDYLRDQVHRWVQDKARVIDRWVAEGRMKPVDAPHLFFVLWAATQTYADFDCQMRAVLKRRRLAFGDYAAGAALITRMVLGACGIRTGNGTDRRRVAQGSDRRG